MKRFILSYLLTVLICVTANGQQTYELTASAYSVAPGEQFEISYTYTNTHSENDDGLRFWTDYGVLKCKQLEVIGSPTSSNEISRDRYHEGGAHSLIFAVRAAKPGIIKLPAEYTINKKKDTIWSNAITITVVAGKQKEMFPTLTEKDLFASDSELQASGAASDFEVMAKISRMLQTRKLPYPAAMGKFSSQLPTSKLLYVIHAGLVYHRMVEGKERVKDTKLINKLVTEIGKYLGTKRPVEPLGLFLPSCEPVCVFLVSDTSDIRAGLDRIYAKYPSFVCETIIQANQGFATEMLTQSDIRKIWLEVDWHQKILASSHDSLDRKRKIYAKLFFHDSAAAVNYCGWAEEKGYTVEETGPSNGPEKGTEILISTLSDARRETLFKIIMLHRDAVKTIRGSRYYRLWIGLVK